MHNRCNAYSARLLIAHNNNNNNNTIGSQEKTKWRGTLCILKEMCDNEITKINCPPLQRMWTKCHAWCGHLNKDVRIGY